MAFKAKFYSFTKKVNSTKKPANTDVPTDYDIILKDACSLLHPVIQLDYGLSTNPASFNYCYIPNFNRYYFVSDWVFNDRLWEARLTVDPLASFKTSIGSYSGYVLRSSHSSDGNIVDTYYPALADITTTKEGTAQDPSWSNDFSGGSYVIGVMGKDNGQNGGAITYYKASSSGMNALCNYLLDVANLGTITDIETDLLKCIFNPLQYIVSCMWFPFSPTVVNGDIYVGWWDVSSSGIKPLTSSLKWDRSMTYDIPKHPKAATRGNYLNLAPFSKYHLYAGPFGVIPIDGAYLLGKTSLNTHVTIDLVTGSGKLAIEDANGYILEEHFAQVGVPVTVGQNLINQGAISGVTGGAMDTIGAIFKGSPTSMLGSGLETIGNAAELSQSVPSTVGSNGSCTFRNDWQLIGRFFDVADEDNTSRGRPLCKAVQMSTVSGYILCSDADPAVPCTDAELSQIVSYMNGGFYYE